MLDRMEQLLADYSRKDWSLVLKTCDEFQQTKVALDFYGPVFYRTLAVLGNYDRAQRVLDDYIMQSGDDCSAPVDFAILLCLQERWALAENKLQRILESWPFFVSEEGRDTLGILLAYCIEQQTVAGKAMDGKIYRVLIDWFQR